MAGIVFEKIMQDGYIGVKQKKGNEILYKVPYQLIFYHKGKKEDKLLYL